MYTEKRQYPRFPVNLPVEIYVMDQTTKLCQYFVDLRDGRQDICDEEPRRVCGYIGNMSEGGVGVTTLELLWPRAKVDLYFRLPGTETVTTPAILVFTGLNGDLHYYGFQFNSLGEFERRALKAAYQEERIYCLS